MPVSYLMIGVTLLLLPILVYMTVRVTGMVWENEKVVPLMLITLCFTLLNLLLYWSYVIYSTNHPEWSCSDAISYKCESSVFAYLPALFLANAVILNLNKWVYFKLRINAFIQVGFGMNEDRCLGGSDTDQDDVLTDSDASVSARRRHSVPKTFDSFSDQSRESAVMDMYEAEN